MYPSIWHKKLDVQDKKSTIIIGGGIAGLSLAYWLSKKKIKTILLEREFIGSGASGRNAGFLTGGSLSYFETLIQKYGEEKALEKWFYTKENIDLLKSELKLSENSKSYLSSGTMTLLRSPDEKYERAFRLLERYKYPVKKMASPLQDFKQAYLFEEEAFNDPMETLSLLRKKVEKFCEIKEGVNVHSIEEGVLKTNVGEIHFDKVFVATNFGLTELLNLSEKIRPQRAQIAYFETDSKLPPSNIMVPEERVYLRKYLKGVLIGGLRLIDADNENTSLVDLNSKIQKELQRWCERYFENVKLRQKWAGIMGFTHDEQPISGHFKNNIYYLGGFSGHGNGYAFRMAKELIELAY